MSAVLMTTLKNILGEIKRELKAKEKIRTTAQEDMRKATSLSKQAILMIHQKRIKEANRLSKEARQIILRLTEISREHPDMIYGGMFDAASQEYAESNIFLTLVDESRFIAPDEINVSSINYVLGLADVIGEYRRLSLDALREDDTKKAEECLQTMDEIYVELMGMDESYMLVPGLRRKSDIARRIIEITRGDVTQEIRRSRLEKYLQRFEKKSKKS